MNKLEMSDAIEIALLHMRRNHIKFRLLLEPVELEPTQGLLFLRRISDGPIHVGCMGYRAFQQFRSTTEKADWVYLIEDYKSDVVQCVLDEFNRLASEINDG